MRDLKPTIFFVSAEHVEDHPRANCDASTELEDLLNEVGLNYREVEGYSNGYHEAVFMVVGAGAEHEVQQLASNYNQGAYLRSDGDRNTYLCNPDTGAEKHIGMLREVTSEQAKKSGSYTFDPVTQAYWRVS